MIQNIKSIYKEIKREKKAPSASNSNAFIVLQPSPTTEQAKQKRQGQSRPERAQTGGFLTRSATGAIPSKFGASNKITAQTGDSIRLAQQKDSDNNDERVRKNYIFLDSHGDETDPDLKLRKKEEN